MTVLLQNSKIKRWGAWTNDTQLHPTHVHLHCRHYAQSHPLILLKSVERWCPEDQECNVILGCLVSWRSAWDAWDPVWTNNKYGRGILDFSWMWNTVWRQRYFVSYMAKALQITSFSPLIQISNARPRVWIEWSRQQKP